MTTTPKDKPPGSSSAAASYTNALGETIPDDAFENDFGGVRPVPLTEEQRRKFDEETEALRKFKK